jgi:hypothetical protein
MGETMTDARREGPVAWDADSPAALFVAGAAWWQFHQNDSTMFPSERREAEDEAVRRGLATFAAGRESVAVGPSDLHERAAGMLDAWACVQEGDDREEVLRVAAELRAVRGKSAQCHRLHGPGPCDVCEPEAARGGEAPVCHQIVHEIACYDMTRGCVPVLRCGVPEVYGLPAGPPQAAADGLCCERRAGCCTGCRRCHVHCTCKEHSHDTTLTIAVAAPERPIPAVGEHRCCIICSRLEPWGVFDTATGAVVCVRCRDGARRQAAGVDVAGDEATVRLREDLAEAAMAVCDWAKAMPSGWSIPDKFMAALQHAVQACRDHFAPARQWGEVAVCHRKPHEHAGTDCYDPYCPVVRPEPHGGGE